MLLNLTILPGDGIGPEVTEQAVLVLQAVADAFGHQLQLQSKNIGGVALAASNDPLPADTIQACLASSAVLLGAVGNPAYDHYPQHLRPEAGLLRLRRELGAYANLRPAICFPALEGCSPLRPELVRGTDIMIVRELLGGLYFGDPRSIQGEPGARIATNTMTYGEPAIERIARVAFELATKRRKKVLSVDKANVLECSRLWREVVTRCAKNYPEVQLSHMYVDSAAMSLVQRPKDFDVILTENMFGDILSDQAGGVVGSLGLLASASIGGPVGVYEPVHGSAPDIAGKGIANPLGAILSAALLLRHSFQLESEAGCIESAVAAVLRDGYRTADLSGAGQSPIKTAEMGGEVVAKLRSGLTGEKSPPRKFGPVRRLRDSERALVHRMLQQEASKNTALLSRLDSLDVQEMPDGGMGSLYFSRPGKDAHARRFGRRIAETQFDDADGVLVVASLNADQDGDLYELDIRRTDFKPVISLGPPSR
jgi:3-isopropylmalate dehydrogenase